VGKASIVSLYYSRPVLYCRLLRCRLDGALRSLHADYRPSSAAINRLAVTQEVAASRKQSIVHRFLLADTDK